MSDNYREICSERLFSVRELAKEWGVSADTVRRRFMKEAGVIVIRNPRIGRRAYNTLRIPASVVSRVQNK